MLFLGVKSQNINFCNNEIPLKKAGLVRLANFYCKIDFKMYKIPPDTETSSVLVPELIRLANFKKFKI